MLLKTLIRESIAANDIATGRPAIAGIARKVSNKLHSKLVHTASTSQPIATVLAVRYFANGVGILDNDSSVQNVDDENIDHIEVLTDSTIEAGTQFFVKDVLYTAVKEFNIGSKVPSESDIANLLFTDVIVPSANTSTYDQIAQVSRVQAAVQSHLTSFSASTELLTDLDRSGVSGLSSDDVISDIISTTIAEVTNRDVIDTLKSIAVKTPKLTVDASVYEQPRQLITHINRLAAQILTDTRTPATFVLCSPKVGAALQASGQDIGLEVVVDPNAVVDYVVVGAAHDADQPSALYYCPLVTDEGSTTLLFTGDPLSLNPNYGAINRYALVIAPDLDDVGEYRSRPVQSLDRVSACGTVKLARACLVTMLK